MRVTEGLNVEIRSHKEGNKLRIEVLSEINERDTIKNRLDEYLNNFKLDDFSKVKIPFKYSIGETEKEIFLQMYKQQITNLKKEIELIRNLRGSGTEDNLQFEFLRKLEKSPNELLENKIKAPIYFLTADLKGYSFAVYKNEQLYASIQSFLFEQCKKIEKGKSCLGSKTAGDNIMIFFTNGTKLIYEAEKIINSFKEFNKLTETFIEGFRVVLSYGECYRVQYDEKVDFVGDPIVQAVRIDPVMKNYIKEKGENSNQIWCTERFKKSLSYRGKKIRFKKLPVMPLAKEYPEEVRLYKIELAKQ